MAEPSRLRAVVRRTVWRLRGWPQLSSLERLGLRVGEKVYVGNGAYLDPDFCHLIELRDRVTLSVNVTVLAHDAAGRHVVDYGRVAPVLVDEDVFVGAGAIILPGVTIGARAIVAAGSVVIHDVAPDTIVGGNPARPIGDRATFKARHEARRDGLPSWKRAGWTTTTGITPERIAEMRSTLAEHGEGYIT